MATPKVKQREFLLARAFLRRLGGNIQNTYLILAIIAWQRAMAKAHDPFWNSLRHYTAAAAGAKLAGRILSKAGAGKYKAEYKALIKRLRNQSSKGADMAAQAADFILGIEKSHYDSKHYGYVAYAAGHYVTTTEYDAHDRPYDVTKWVPEVAGSNPLFDAYAALTNNPNIPNSWWITTSKTTTKHTKVIPPRPHQPRSLMHVLPTREYVQPYQAEHFYMERPHYGDNVLIDD